MAGVFESAWQKWSRATTHAVALQEQLNTWQVTLEEAGGIRIGVDCVYEPENERFRLQATEVKVLPPELSLLVGDVAHNYRCALDHIAWAMVGRGSEPGRQVSDPRDIGFLVAKTAADFRSLVGKRLPGITDGDLAVVKSMQPYQVGEAGLDPVRLQDHALRICSDFDNDDKHREIQPGYLIPNGRATCHIVQGQDCEWGDASPPAEVPGLFEKDVNLGYIAAAPLGPDPKLEVSFRVMAHVAVTPRIPIAEWLERTYVFMEVSLRSLG